MLISLRASYFPQNSASIHHQSVSPPRWRLSLTITQTENAKLYFCIVVFRFIESKQKELRDRREFVMISHSFLCGDEIETKDKSTTNASINNSNF
jgi:hypothetical protein